MQPCHGITARCRSRCVALLTDPGATSCYQCAMKQYLGNRSKLMVHDLSEELPGCQIALIEIGHREWFSTLRNAHMAGYKNCPKCLPIELLYAREN